MRVNAGGVEAVAQACADQPDRPVLVLVSSLAAAGHSGDRPAIESESAAPVSDYGRSKLAGEQVAMRYADTLPITVVRPCIVFGAGDRGMFEVFKPIARSGLHAVVGSGDNSFSLIAVADLIECLVLAAEQGERLAPGIAGRGIYFAAAEDVSYRRPWPVDSARARQAVAPHSSHARVVAALHRLVWRCRVADPRSSRVGRPRQDPRGSRRFVDVFVGEGAAAVGLVAGSPSRRSVARNRAVVPGCSLALSGPRRCRRRTLTARGRRSDRSWSAWYRPA